VYAGCPSTAHMYTWEEEKMLACTCDCPQDSPCTPSISGKKKRNARVNSPFLCVCRMYVHWREREHEEIDFLVSGDPASMVVLSQCGLLKFFQCSFMRAQPRLLNALIYYWHPNVDAFMLKGQSLTPTTEDIYFLTGLSRRGDPVNLHTFLPGPHNIEEFIGLHCEAGTEKVGYQVPIHKISNLSLKLIVLLIGWITGSAALHQDSRAYMHCAVQCLNARIFN
jgi:hypothetical protein